MRRNEMNIRRLCLWLLALLLLAACGKDDDEGKNRSVTEWETRKVAIIAPYHQSQDIQNRLERTAKWFQDNFEVAQKNLKQGIKLELEWHDEEAEDMKALGHELATREDIVAVIGPKYSVQLDVLASEYATSGKPLIAPVASAEEVIRKYSASEAGTKEKTPFLWSLTETDISQSEVLLSVVTGAGDKRIALLSSDDTYGKTFNEWIPFLAHELDLELVANLTYHDEASLHSAIAKLLATDADYAICALANSTDVVYVAQQRLTAGDQAPRLLFTDSSMNPDLMHMDEVGEGIEGVSMYADPLSGFQLSYNQRFNVPPDGSEAQYYDALMLVGFAAFYCQHTGETNINEAIRIITSQTDGYPVNAWDKMGMQLYLTYVEDGILPNLRGATGNIKFDQEAFTTVLYTVYAHWLIHNGDVVTIDYASRDGNGRTTATMASWKWRAQQMQDVYDEETTIEFGKVTSQWAVLVAGSYGWDNYRHQTDVLNMYQLLKNFGWDDEHIILIMNDDIAHDPNNQYTGEVRASPDGENLYHDVVVDYRADTLSHTDIRPILLGQQSNHLPQVVHADSGSNLLLYWSGHGRQGYFSWMDNKRALSDEQLRETLQQMETSNGYRKLLLCTEPCYSASMAKMTEGITGALAIASSSELESSFADNYSVALKIWMSDRFTNNLITCLTANPAMTYKELYSYLVSHTMGSHVHIYNAPLFGNLYRDDPSEFFVYRN
ncbi:MAG: ABC transporter substrate-binding protein [Prevotella sp.]|nr:ABC transporter substrate-binding protein [Prevotella sp.]